MRRLKRKRLTKMWNKYYSDWKSIPWITFKSRFSNRPLSYEETKRR